MATTNLDAANLQGARAINEDVMQKIFDISPLDTPFMNMAMKGSAKNQYTEWTLDRLNDPDFGNHIQDGSTATGNDTVLTSRVGNHCQVSNKVVRVSGRARKVDTIGRGDELAYQLVQRGKEIRRDIEAIALSNQASRADNGSTNAGLSGGVSSWMETNTNRGTGGADGGFASNAVSAPTVGTARALSEATLRAVIADTYVQGGNAGVLMMTPNMKQRVSGYLFTSSARVGELQTQTGMPKTSGGSKSDSAMTSMGATAQGSVSVYISDYGALMLKPNRFMLDYASQGSYGAANITDVYLLDMSYWGLNYLRPFTTQELAKTGDADNRQIIVDWTVCSKNEAASGLIADVNDTLAMTA